MGEIRAPFAWLDGDRTVILCGPDGDLQWWTFAGAGANATLAKTLSDATQRCVDHDSFTLGFGTDVLAADVERALHRLRGQSLDEMRPAVEERAIEGLKFAECLPGELAVKTLQERLRNEEAARRIIAQDFRCVSTHG
jgi:ATP-dependent Lhr-like helicase